MIIIMSRFHAMSSSSFALLLLVLPVSLLWSGPVYAAEPLTTMANDVLYCRLTLQTMLPQQESATAGGGTSTMTSGAGDLVACRPVLQDGQASTSTATPYSYSFADDNNNDLFAAAKLQLGNGQDVFMSIPGGRIEQGLVVVPDHGAAPPGLLDSLVPATGIPPQDQDQRLQSFRAASLVHGQPALTNSLPLSHESSFAVPTTPTLQDQSRSRNLQYYRRPASTGTLTMLVVRILATDAVPTPTRNDLQYYLFDAPASLQSQLYACSAGKLRVVPVPTMNAIMDVRVNVRATGSQYSDLVDAAYEAALASIGGAARAGVTSIRELADLIVMVVPPGTRAGSQEDWVGFGDIFGPQTVFNDSWALYLGALNHEVMHNLGLLHSWEGGSDYGDVTGYMGSTVKELGYPRKCYNAQNHAQLGWYDDRLLQINDTRTNSAMYSVAAFVDYQYTNPSQYVVVSIPSLGLFMQYNRAKNFNIDTGAYPDQLVIVQETSQGSNMVAYLDETTQPFAIRLQGQQEFTIEVCGASAGSPGQSPDIMMVSIGTGRSACNQVPVSAQNYYYANAGRSSDATMQAASQTTSAPVPVATPAPQTSAPYTSSPIQTTAQTMAPTPAYERTTLEPTKTTDEASLTMEPSGADRQTFEPTESQTVQSTEATDDDESQNTETVSPNKSKDVEDKIDPETDDTSQVKATQDTDDDGDGQQAHGDNGLDPTKAPKGPSNKPTAPSYSRQSQRLPQKIVTLMLSLLVVVVAYAFFRNYCQFVKAPRLSSRRRNADSCQSSYPSTDFDMDQTFHSVGSASCMPESKMMDNLLVGSRDGPEYCDMEEPTVPAATNPYFV